MLWQNNNRKKNLKKIIELCLDLCVIECVTFTENESVPNNCDILL